MILLSVVGRPALERCRLGHRGWRRRRRRRVPAPLHLWLPRRVSLSAVVLLPVLEVRDLVLGEDLLADVAGGGAVAGPAEQLQAGELPDLNKKLRSAESETCYIT